MADSNTSMIVRNLEKYGSSPATLQRDALQAIRNILNNEHGIISPENPVAMLLEISATQTAGAIGKNFLLNRRQYPVAAQTHEDLYYHLSDLDWVGVFALPSEARFSVSFNYDEVLDMLKPLPDGSGNLLRIPRGTQITVGNIDFLLDYPVNILQLKHGGFRITYDTTESSPIQTLKSNIVPFNIAIVNKIKYLTLALDLVQLKEIVVEDSITSATTIDNTKSFIDQYFFSRVYTGNDQTGWKELTTTHCPDVYDLHKPTAVLKLINGKEENKLNVTIPKIYNNTIIDPTGMETSTLGSRIRIEIYATVGELSMNLAEYTYTQFKWDFYPAGDRKRDYSGLGDYSSAFQSIKTVLISSSSFISQGRDQLSFDELRQRVIDNTVGPNKVPISHLAIEDKNQDHGFRIIKSVDYVTNRIYWAIREMPKPISSKLITPAAASIETLITSITELVSTGTVIDNGKRVTITPDSVYRMNNGKLTILDKTEIDRIKDLSPENKAQAVNSEEMFYSPFHYVVDTDNSTIKLRPYYLDNPTCITKSFVDSNNKIDVSLTIMSYDIERTKKGFVLTCVMGSNDVYKRLADDEIWAHMLIHPFKDKGYVYVQGKMVGRTTDTREPIFQFELDTNFDIDENHCLIFNNTSLQGTNNIAAPIELEGNWEILFGFYGDMPNWSRIKTDDKIGTHLVNPNAKVILCESIKVRLGHYLEYLWTRARSYADEIQYQRYQNDVPLLYQEDVYEADAATGSIINVVNGQVQYNLAHRKGDPVLDKQGNPILKHRAGDTVLDDNGEPIIAEPRKIIRRLELMLIDGVYWFATDTIASEYRSEIVATFIDWLTDDLVPLNEKTLEQTRILFYPSATMGQIKVMYNEGIETFIDAAQSLKIDLTVNKQVYNDYDIREKIREATIKVLNDEIKKETVSRSSIIKQLTKEHGDDVIGIAISGLGGNDRIVSFTVIEEGKRATVRKKLTVQADETLGVTEDVTFNFILHSRDQID